MPKAVLQIVTMNSTDSSDDTSDVVDDFLTARGLNEGEDWDKSYNKKQCPDCGGIHDSDATKCNVCGWLPT